MSEIKDVIVQGLWKNNSALVQLLGLCPLLAVTSTATNALGLGLATTLVLTLTNLTISTLRHWTPAEIRIPIYVMIIASVVSAVQMLINAYAFGLYQSLGIFIPLIVTNCIVVGRAEAFAAKKGPALSALDGFSIGMGATCAMFVLGSLREIIGNGTLFDGADALLGSWAKVLRVEIFHTERKRPSSCYLSFISRRAPSLRWATACSILSCRFPTARSASCWTAWTTSATPS